MRLVSGNIPIDSLKLEARGAQYHSNPGFGPRLQGLLELPIDYQRLRHGWGARIMRRALFRFVVGREAWPLVFRQPSGEGPQGTSPHLYVHLPFCRQICPHCPYTKVLLRGGLAPQYAVALRREIEEYFAERQPPPVSSLYFGGGTPSATPDLIRECLEGVKPRLLCDAQVGVEVHPADASPALLTELHRMGVNRISLGIESFRPNLLKQLGRTYTPAAAEQAIRDARAAGFDCVDVNLLCAIPGQGASETAQDARRCLDLGVDQISAYTLFSFVHTPLGEQTEQRSRPVYGDVTRLQALREIASVCLAAGFLRTSPWNFTRPGVPPYSTVTQEDYVGFGAGAGSKVGGVFWFNTFSVPEYTAQIRNGPALVLEASPRVRRFHWLYWQLYRMEVDPDRYRTLFARDLGRDFGVALATLRVCGMLRRQGAQLRVTEFGAVWMHRLQQLFSITYIDKLWSWSQGDAWPREVVLE